MGSREGGGWLRALPRMVDVASSKWQVTAILVLHGLPWLLTGSILAHEVCGPHPLHASFHPLYTSSFSPAASP